MAAGSSDLYNSSLDDETILVCNASREVAFSNRVIVRVSDFENWGLK
jgi:hypothetical protein